MRAHGCRLSPATARRHRAFRRSSRLRCKRRAVASRAVDGRDCSGVLYLLPSRSQPLRRAVIRVAGTKSGLPSIRCPEGLPPAGEASKQSSQPGHRLSESASAAQPLIARRGLARVSKSSALQRLSNFGGTYPVTRGPLPCPLVTHVWTGGALQEKIGEPGAFWSRTNVSGLEVELIGSWPSWI
jgi:hypothetical protein